MFVIEPNNIEIEPEQKFYVNLAVYNQSKHTETLPVGVIADITPMTDEHQADFSKAASETASDMACEAVEQLEQVELHQNLYRKAQHKQAKVCHDTLPHPFKSFNPLHAQKEMNIAFRKNSEPSFNQLTNLYYANHLILSDESRDLPPLSDTTLDPFSEDYKDMVVEAIHLHDIAISPLHKKLNLSLLFANMPMFLCYQELHFAELTMSNTVLRLVMLNPNTQRHIPTLLFNYSLSNEKFKKWLNKTF
jgi:hypothetical protein